MGNCKKIFFIKKISKFKIADYATKMLAEGPLDQVLGFLMASMPDDVRICLNLFSGKYFEYSRQADKQIIRGF